MGFSMHNIGSASHTACLLLHFPPLHFWPYRIFHSRIFSRPNCGRRLVQEIVTLSRFEGPGVSPPESVQIVYAIYCNLVHFWPENGSQYRPQCVIKHFNKWERRSHAFPTKWPHDQANFFAAIWPVGRHTLPTFCIATNLQGLCTRRPLSVPCHHLSIGSTAFRISVQPRMEHSPPSARDCRSLSLSLSHCS